MHPRQLIHTPQATYESAPPKKAEHTIQAHQ